MGKYKNAQRQHLIAPYTRGASVSDEEYMPLAQYISGIEATPEYDVEDVAWYHGDGTPEQNIISIAKAYDVEGVRYYGDEAQDHIAGMEGKRGDDAKVWHKIIRADGKKQYEGVATVTDIVVDGGEADEDEAFGFSISYDEFPEITDAVPGA